MEKIEGIMHKTLCLFLSETNDYNTSAKIQIYKSRKLCYILNNLLNKFGNIYK